MKRATLCAAMLAVALATPAMARTQTYFGFQIGISNAPPPPRTVFYDEPSEIYRPSEHVYVVADDDYDVFRCDGSYYVCQDGYWYRSPRYRGPWATVDVRYVPRPIFSVPVHYWRHREHWGPSRVRYVETNYRQDPRRYKDDDRRWTPSHDRRDDGDRRDEGRGHGHGRGHDKHGGHGHD